jgi:hypothetical protein
VQGANYLSLSGIRSVMGYSGTEIHRYDELLGRQGDERRFLYHPTIWRLLAVRYVMADQVVAAPELQPVDSQPLSMMERPGAAVLHRYREAEPYAYLVPVAVRVPEDQQVPVIVDPRFDPRRFLVVPLEAPVGDTRISALPEPIALGVRVTPRRAGAYDIELAAPAPAQSFLFFSENWHPGWSVRVNGREGQVLRAQHTLIGVPLQAGDRTLELTFHDPRYPLGRAITLLTIVGLLAVWAQAWWTGRRPAVPGAARA